MNKMKFFGRAAVVALAFAMSTSCNNDDNNGGGGSTPDGTYIKGKIDGTSWQSLEIAGQSVAIATTMGSGVDRVILVNGSGDMSGTDSMVIQLIGIDAPGTYDINPDTNSLLAYVKTSEDKSYDTSDCSAATGTVTITTINDTKIEGSFSFTGKVDEDCSQTKTVTNGTFRGVFMQN
ncbi:MAG: hypothetical protein EOO51_03765 [Flavobacterium sp.]|nr:MAG: hypothetical protein EOO51_03765 [Flavobacterium sp.]